MMSESAAMTETSSKRLFECQKSFSPPSSEHERFKCPEGVRPDLNFKCGLTSLSHEVMDTPFFLQAKSNNDRAVLFQWFHHKISPSIKSPPPEPLEKENLPRPTISWRRSRNSRKTKQEKKKPAWFKDYLKERRMHPLWTPSKAGGGMQAETKLPRSTAEHERSNDNQRDQYSIIWSVFNDKMVL